MKTDAGAGATAINPRRFQTRHTLYVSFVNLSKNAMFFLPYAQSEFVVGSLDVPGISETALGV